MRPPFAALLPLLVFSSGAAACGDTVELGGGASAGGASNGDPSGGFGAMPPAVAGSGGSTGAGATASIDCSMPPVRPLDQHRILATDQSIGGMDLRLATDGSARVLWQEVSNPGRPDGTSTLFSSYYDGSSWSPAETVVSTSSSSLQPLRLVDVSGGAPLVVWSEFGPDGRLYAAERRPEGMWPVTTIAEGTATILLSDVVQHAGALTAVWINIVDDYAQTLYAARRETSTEPWSAPLSLAAVSSDGYIDSAETVVLDDGTVVVLWSHGEGAGFSTRAAHYDPNSHHWIQAELSPRGEYRPALAQSGTRAIAAWMEDAPLNHSNVFVAELERGVWSAPELVYQNSPAADDVSVALAPDGHVLVIWQIYDPDQIVYTSRSPGGGWAPLTVVPHDGSHPIVPLAWWVPCRGAHLVIWGEYGHEGFYFAWWDGKTGLGEVHPPDLSSGFALDPFGNALHLWSDPSRKELMGQWRVR